MSFKLDLPEGMVKIWEENLVQRLSEDVFNCQISIKILNVPEVSEHKNCVFSSVKLRKLFWGPEQSGPPSTSRLLSKLCKKLIITYFKASCSTVLSDQHKSHECVRLTK